MIPRVTNVWPGDNVSAGDAPASVCGKLTAQAVHGRIGCDISTTSCAHHTSRGAFDHPQLAPHTPSYPLCVVWGTMPAVLLLSLTEV